MKLRKDAINAINQDFQMYIRLSPWMAKALQYLSDKSGMDYTNSIRTALNDYIKKELTNDELNLINEPFLKKVLKNE